MYIEIMVFILVFFILLASISTTLMFRRFIVQCPKCGECKEFKSEGYIYVSRKKNPREIRFKDEENYDYECENPNCKTHFSVDTGLTEGERWAKKNVLDEGEDRGWWIVDGLVAGGSLLTRGAIGADFAIYRKGGGTLWIEFKRHHRFYFTWGQLYRFRTSIDSKAVATRFIGLMKPQQRKYAKLNNQLFFWTPAFFQTLPKDSWKKPKKKKMGQMGYMETLSMRGLRKCIFDNTMTVRDEISEELFPLNPEQLQEICGVPNLSLFNHLKGRLFVRGANYERFSMDEAAKILIAKLRYVIENLDEDILWQEHFKYKPCQKVLSKRDLIIPIARQLILETLSDSYRALFPREVTYQIQNDEEIDPFLIWGDDGYPYVQIGTDKLLLRLVVKNIMKKLTSEGQLNQIRAEDEEHFSYVLDGVATLPLTYGSSQSLDRLKEFLEIQLERIANEKLLDISELRERKDFNSIAKAQFPATLEEISDVLGWDLDKLKPHFRVKYRDELERNGLIRTDLRSIPVGRPNLEISLTNLGIEYVSRVGRFMVED